MGLRPPNRDAHTWLSLIIRLPCPPLSPPPLHAESASTGEITVTNDGATILKSISLDNAAAKILVNISKVQDDEVGDGTTSVCVLAAELLREGERLVNMKIHPQTIVEGYRIASKRALEALEAAAQDHASVPASLCFFARLVRGSRPPLHSSLHI